MEFTPEYSLWRMLNSVIVGIMMCLIIYITLGNRTLQIREICLIPFDSFARAKIQPEIYRSMLMNVFLFFPLGLILPYALPERWKGKRVFTVVLALLLSVGIEFLQYRFCLGRAETDDVIANVVGSIFGIMSQKNS